MLYAIQAVIIIVFAYKINQFFRYLSVTPETEWENALKKSRLGILRKLANKPLGNKSILYYSVAVLIFIFLWIGFILAIISIIGAFEKFKFTIEKESWWAQIILYMGLSVFILFIKEILKKK